MLNVVDVELFSFFYFCAEYCYDECCCAECRGTIYKTALTTCVESVIESNQRQTLTRQILGPNSHKIYKNSKIYQNVKIRLK